MVEELAGEFADRGVKFWKVNIAAAEEAAAGYGVFAVPTLLFFRDGEVVDKVEGLQSKPQLKTRVSELLDG